MLARQAIGDTAITMLRVVLVERSRHRGGVTETRLKFSGRGPDLGGHRGAGVVNVVPLEVVAAGAALALVKWLPI